MNLAEQKEEGQPGAQMSFLEHLDEVRKRLVRSVIFVALAFMFCWYFSGNIYNFLAIPINKAVAEAQQREVAVEGISGNEKILTLSALSEGDSGRYIFDQETKLGVAVVPKGAAVLAKVGRNSEGKIGLFTEEPIITSSALIPKGVDLKATFEKIPDQGDEEGRLIVSTATEPFTLYVTVSLYAAIALSVPFLLLQIWGFISPALYAHEKGYVTPFILLSSTSFIGGAAFAYYILFPPAVRYLLWLGKDFSLMLKATDYFDFITLIMLAMGIIFQMPAVAYILSRIGLINAQMMIKSWKIALVVILIVAAVVSPTADIPNMMLFASPMIVLYIFSVFIAWFFGKERKKEA